MIEHLLWDSEFFGLKVGRIILKNDLVFDYTKILKICREEYYNLIYIFCANTDIHANFNIRNTGAVLYDEKITFQKKVESAKHLTDVIIKPYFSQHIPDNLYRLGIQSGEYSRFKIDKKITKGKFEALYKKWVENSVNKTFADETFLYWKNEKIAGFITVKCNRNEGTIGLIAVDYNFRGQAIGTQLLNYTENYLACRSIENLTVVTQSANMGAVNFYKKNGFLIRDITNIYHLWIA